MRSINKKVVLVTRIRVGYDGSYRVVVPDHASGKANRFTVYRLPASPSRRTQVLGRELPLKLAMTVAKAGK